MTATPSRGAWTRADHKTGNHESGHALAALFFPGLVLYEVRIDNPGDYGGLTSIGVERGRTFERLLFCLAGVVGERERMPWPPAGPEGTDEASAAAAVGELGMTELEWNDAHALVLDALCLKPMRRAGGELAHRLLEQGIVSGEEARTIYDEAWRPLQP